MNRSSRLGQSSAVLVLSLLLASCGGGGGGGGGSPSPSAPAPTPAPAPAPASFTDGLGSSGLSAAAQDLGIGAIANGEPFVAIDDQGNALALWEESPSTTSLSTISWSAQPAGGTWSTQQQLTQVGKVDVPDTFILKSAADGNAAFLWLVPAGGTNGGITSTLSGLRYRPTAGWQSASFDASSNDSQVDFALPTRDISDYTVLTGGSSVYTEVGMAGGSPAIFTYAQPYALPRQAISDGSYFQATFASNPDGEGVLIAAVAHGTSGLLYDIVATPTSTGVATTVASAVQLCHFGYARSFIASTSTAGLTSVVMLLQDPSDTSRDCRAVDLEAIRFNNLTPATTIQARLDSANVGIEPSPELLTDSAGDALVAWIETSNGNSESVSVRYSSLAAGGTAWSAGASMITNPNIVGPAIGSSVSMALNAAGVGFAGVFTSPKSNATYLCTTRFSFTSGWSACQPIADIGYTPFSVAINDSGNGAVIFQGPQVTRDPTTLVPTPVQLGTTPDIHTYVLIQAP